MTAGFFWLQDTITGLFAVDSVVPHAEAILRQEAPEVLDYAKANAPWQDITGAARQGLGIDVSAEEEEIVLSLYHSVDYGLWLETIENGKFATIMPTLEHFVSRLLGSVHAVELGEELTP